MAQLSCSSCNHVVQTSGLDTTGVCPMCGGLMKAKSAKPATPVAPASPGSKASAFPELPSKGFRPDVTAAASRSSELPTGRSSARITKYAPRSSTGVYLAAAGIAFGFAAVFLFALHWISTHPGGDASRSRLDALQAKRAQVFDELSAERKLAQELHERENALSREITLAASKNDRNGVSATEVLARAEKSVAIVKTDTGWGTGFIIDEAGLLATNYHVIAGSSKLTVILQQSANHERLELDNVKLIAVNSQRDLALLQLPEVPSAAGVSGRYPALRLRTDRYPQTGEDVFAIGNPGLGSAMLDYTVTRGIVSNPDRTTGGKKYIQVTAVVNPGNSGGPLIDGSGAVVGVVVAKGTSVEAVSLIIPAQDLKDFCAQKSDEPFAIKTNLQDWEVLHDRSAALERKYRSLVSKPLIELNTQPDALLLSADGGKLFTLAGAAGVVAEYSLPDGSAGKICNAGSALTDLVPYGADWLLATAPETGQTVRIHQGTMLVDGHCRTPDPVFAAQTFNSSREPVVLLRRRGRPWLVGQAWFEKEQRDTGEFPAQDPNAIYFAAGATARWLVMASIPMGGTDVRLSAWPRGACLPLLSRFLVDVTQGRAHGARFAQMPVREMSQVHVGVELNEYVMAQEGTSPDRVLTWNGDNEFIFAKRVYRISDTRMECLGTFDTLDDTLRSEGLKSDGNAELKNSIHAIENIFTVSPEGSWAASGLCIYSVSSRSIQKLLPFPCAISSFTPDGRGIYLVGKRGIYFYPDWQAQFPDAKAARH